MSNDDPKKTGSEASAKEPARVSVEELLRARRDRPDQVVRSPEDKMVGPKAGRPYLSK